MSDCYQKGFESAMKGQPSTSYQTRNSAKECTSKTNSQKFGEGYKAGVQEYNSRPQFYSNGFD